MNVSRFFLIPFAIFTLFSCNGNVDEVPSFTEPLNLNLSATETELTGEGQIFGMDLFSAVSAEYKDNDNIIISPLSLNMALAMVWNGAIGETKEAIQKAMGMSAYPQEEVNAYFKKLKDILPKTDPTTKLSLANSIWTRQGFPVKKSFYDINTEWYGAKVSELDFNSPTAPDVINQWCSDNTNGLIKDMIQQISPDVMMYLINALYFKGEWSNKFNASDTKNAVFTKEDGSSVQVKMMNQDHTCLYFHNDYFSATSLPFGNGAFSMIFMLPNDNVSFPDMLNQLKQPGYFAQYLQSSYTADVDLYIPKFKIEYGSISLVKTLQQLGMGIAFTDSADFSGISDVPLFISDVLQKTSVSIDEKGGEAAAVTVVATAYTSAGPSDPPKVVFRADRPFLFLIQESSSGVILFMGKIGQPM